MIAQTLLEKKLEDTQSLCIAIQGVPGAFHEIAARHCFEGQHIDIVPAFTFDELVERTQRKEKVDVALMAIENSIAGTLIPNYKRVHDSSLVIVGEVYLRIVQNLMALPGQSIKDLKEVHSHPIAIEQCREFFRNYPAISLVESEDTALSAKYIKEHQCKGMGAIASSLAAKMYSLEILAPGIETNKANHTRFWVLQPKENAHIDKAANKVSLTFSVNHTVGSLYKVLAVLAAYNINVSKIQSTPILGKPWEYQFYLDFISEGLVPIQSAIDAIRPLANDMHILGIYNQGKHFEE
jgi:prephenate dehydratase